MPLAAIGFALGVGSAATATAAATGVLAATLVGGAVIGAAGYGIASLASNAGKSKESSSISSTNEQDIGNLAASEAQIAASKRMARIGKYFTSPAGDTSSLQAGSQKVFS